MKKLTLILVIIFDVLMAYCFLTIRSLPRLLIWNIKEARNESFFYPTHNRFDYAAFEKETPEIKTFKRNLFGVVDEADNDMVKLVAILDFVQDNYVRKYVPRKGTMLWGPPLSLLSQLNDGRRGINCFHYAIIFNSYATAAGLKTRLWALEGDDYLERFGHSIAEVYVPEYDQWVAVDPSWGIYFLKMGKPLSVLELRNCLVNNKCIPSIAGEKKNISDNDLVALYRRLLKTIFLRSASDFSNKLNNPRLRWGVLSCCADILKKTPYYLQRAVELSFGRKDYFFQYVDEKSVSLYGYTILSRLFFLVVVVLNVWIFGGCRVRKFLKNNQPPR